MARTTRRRTERNRAAISARVSDESRAEEDRSSIAEQMGDMEAYRENRGTTTLAARRR